MNVPKLRFKEFDDAWKKEKLKTSSVIYDGTHETPNYISNGIKFVSVENINNIYKSDKYISEEDYNRYKVKPVKNDIFMTRIGDIGTSNVYDGKEPIAYYVSLALIRTSLNPLYLNQYIKSTKFQKELHNRTIHVAFPKKINTGEIGECNISKCSPEEQNKLANFLSLLDKKIELQSKKVEALKLYKKGLLIYLFKNKICNKKLSECFKFGKAGGTPKSTNQEFYNGDIPFLSISDMSKQGKYISNTEKNITKLGLNNSSAWIVPKNSIIISMYASYGLVSINNIELSTSQAMFDIIVNDECINEYIYYYLYYLYIIGFYDTIVSTGTQSNLNAEQLKNLRIYVPNKIEQKNLSNKLIKFDYKLNLEIQILNKLQGLKKGLMQNMFV